ncbi:MAG: penicillin-binding protein [Eubacteriaceae bacterium]|nr:penicillin-binding protein [Eubacteriaceae bacterium]
MKKAVKGIFIFAFMAGIVLLAWLTLSVPDISAFTYSSAAKTVVMSSDNYELGRISRKNSTYISREQMPNDMVHAVVAVEDKRFYRHFGIDPIGIGRAFFTDLMAGEIVEGGSTITQQTATLIFFDKEKTYIRKLREAVVSIKLERKFTKEEIISIYLNEVYFGGGAYGIYEASEVYFSKQPKDLTLEECAMLAGIIQAPSAYAPFDEKGYALATERKEKVLRLMNEQGYITAEKMGEALAAKVEIKPGPQITFEGGTCQEGLPAYMNKLYRQALAMLEEHCRDKYGLNKEEAQEMALEEINSGLTVHATLSYLTQREALAAAAAQLEGREGEPTCAFAFLDTGNGDVLAYYGSNTYVDMASKPRQPGSTIKPIYMSYLIENGLADRNTVVNDEKFEYMGYSPNNNGQFFGYVTMRETLAQSLNAGSMRFFAMAPIEKLVEFAKGFGFSTLVEADYTPAFALGGLTKGLTPVELAQAYAAIANGGTVYEARYVNYITLKDGTILFPTKKVPRRAMGEGTASQVKSMLESAVIRGTAAAAQTGYATMGKTGTTDDSRDVWFAGSTGSAAAAVWCGNMDAKQVPGLSTSWCMKIYKSTIAEAANNKSIPKGKLAAQRQETMEQIEVAKASPADPSKPVAAEDIVTISIPAFERASLMASELVQTDICTVSGLLYNPLNCPDSTKANAHFVRSGQPKDFCKLLVHSRQP